MEEVQTVWFGISPNCKTENFPKSRCFAALAVNGRLLRSIGRYQSARHALEALSTTRRHLRADGLYYDLGVINNLSNPSGEWMLMLWCSAPD